MIKAIGINNQIQISAQPEKKEIKKINTGRVEEIKQQIKAGTYKIDINKTAKAFANNLL